MKRSAFIAVLLVFGLVLVGCGGDSAADEQLDMEKSQETEEAKVGEVHTVKMVGDADGFYFEPESLTIEPGDKVVWEMVSGAPHNVSFRDQDIPEGAQDVLEEKGAYVSDQFSVPGQNFEVHFTETYPTGTYDYICEPHVASGMTGTLTISP